MRTLQTPLLLSLVLLITALHAQAQQPLYKTYTWEEKPVVQKVTDEESQYPGVILLHSQFSELQVTVNGASSFLTEHKVIHVNSHAGVEKFNKVYIPLSSAHEVVDLKVRSIDPSGKVTLLRRENLKELENVDGYRNFKIFAVEGLAVGGEVEYIYTIKTPAQMYGREVLQSNVPVRRAAYILIFPKRVMFEAKSYNGLKEPQDASYDVGRNSISVAAADIPAIEEEEYSSMAGHLMRVDFKLKYNGVVFDPFAWDKMSGKLLQNSHDPKGAGKVSRMIKSLDLENLPEEEKIKKIEQYIKTNFTLKEGNNPAYEDIKEILSTHVANESGMLKIYVACLTLLGIDANLVFTCARTYGSLDISFSTPLELRDVLLYFPKYKKYIAPAVSHLRFGPAPDNIAGNTGLFISYTSNKGVLEYSSHEFFSIDLLTYEHNNLGVKATITLVDGVPEVKHETFWQGYRAAQYRGIYRDLQESRREEFLKDVTLSDIANHTVLSRKIEGEDVNLSFDADSYFKVHTHYQAPSILEKAGDDYLISVGKIIGKQSELYQEKKRKTNISFHSVANYNHELTLEIPEGYTCSGQDAARIHHVVTDENNKALMEFTSDYKIEGNKLIIKVNEVYKVVFLNKEKYDDFRAVVNSAADFNKLVVVLSKK